MGMKPKKPKIIPTHFNEHVKVEMNGDFVKITEGINIVLLIKSEMCRLVSWWECQQ